MTTTKNIAIGKLEFECIVAGDERNELVIFLHGFPETAFMWIKLMDKIASLGFYCIAPNMRGYSKNACPKGVEHYTLKKLIGDILNLADAFNKTKFHIIGHDWGAVIGWHLVHDHADRISSWSSLSVPHPGAFGAAYKLDKEQRKKSRYIKWFLIPVLPEIYLRWNDFALFRRLWKRSSPEEVANYLSVFKRKHCLTGALNYYRANLGRGKGKRIGQITVPALFIWGKKDLAIGGFAAGKNHKYMKGAYTYMELESGHWLIQANYLDVETAITEHLSKYKTIAD